MARLDRILAQGPSGTACPEPSKSVADGGTGEVDGEAGLTEAQRIFGTGDTFTDPIIAAHVAGVGVEGEEVVRGALTAADIAASARYLEQQAASAHQVLEYFFFLKHVCVCIHVRLALL